ncbi:DUF3300 domain-containing protein [Glaciimonas sp. GNP009]
MLKNKKTLSLMLSTTLCVAMLPLAGCDKTKAPDQPAVDASPAKPAYVPPTAEQLYQMVGPIALFPDKLVAQVLAGSTYPDQITAADAWLGQNKNLKGAALVAAANQQPWDVSVKGLTTFPDVLDQMASNIQWTSALGAAYVNDPTDVMNAIQVMRQRASTSGNLKTTKQQKIAVVTRANRTPPQGYVLRPGEPAVYSGPEIIPAPPDMIMIEPTEPDYVYVPTYNPRVVYGDPVAYYPGYSYAPPPPPRYSTGEVVSTGAISFGLGVAVGVVISNSNWGWNSWGMRWGGDRDGGGDRGRGRDDDRGRGDSNGGSDGGGWHRPAVVYNNATYVSRSSTVVNQVTNNNYNNNYNNHNNNSVNNANNNNSINTRNNTTNNGAPGQGGSNSAPANVAPNAAANNVANSNNATRPNFAPQNQQRDFVTGAGLGTAGQGATRAGPPNVNNMNHGQSVQNNGGRAPGPGPAGPAAGVATPGVATPANTAPNFNKMSRPDFSHVAPRGGNVQQNQQRPDGNQANPADSGRPRQNQEHAESNPQNRPAAAAGVQVRPDAAHSPATPVAQHPEQRPQGSPQERPQPQARPQMQSQQQAQQQQAQQQAHAQAQQQERAQAQQQERAQAQQQGRAQAQQQERAQAQQQERAQAQQQERAQAQQQERAQAQQQERAQAQQQERAQAQQAQRAQVQQQERSQAQIRPPAQQQERSQPQAQPQAQPHPQAPNNHPEAHEGGGRPHPDKKDENKHE